MITYKTNLNCNLNEFHNWNITVAYVSNVRKMFCCKVCALDSTKYSTYIGLR